MIGAERAGYLCFILSLLRKWQPRSEDAVEPLMNILVDQQFIFEELLCHISARRVECHIVLSIHVVQTR